MIHIGLFEGIGGFGLAAHWAGWKTYATCEINPFGRRVLEHYWPGAYHHGDIKTLDYGTIDVELSKRFGGKWRDDETIVTGGFPCQPFSVAGQRKGTEDDRHLWPEMLRVVREIGPDWVVGENVLGIVSWSDGLVFEQVQADLEAEGYEVQPYVLPAASVDAPHKRYRVWFVAHAGRLGQEVGQERAVGVDELREERTAAHARGERLERETGAGVQGNRARLAEYDREFWRGFPTQSPIHRRNDGLPDRLAGITVPKWRKESVMAMGNAIVPQVAYQIFKTINDYERNNTKR